LGLGQTLSPTAEPVIYQAVINEQPIRNHLRPNAVLLTLACGFEFVSLPIGLGRDHPWRSGDQALCLKWKGTLQESNLDVIVQLRNLHVVSPKPNNRLLCLPDEQAIHRLVIQQALLPLVSGLVAGVLASFGIERLVATLVFGVGPRDPIAIASVATLLTVVAVVAAYLPARRAVRVNPIVALRYE
jgi:hypothetical protein